MSTIISRALDTVQVEFEPMTRQEEGQIYRSFYGTGRNKYQVFPDFWKKEWGQAPLLGIVYAEDVFSAERVAYDCGISSPQNCSFGLKFKLSGQAKIQAQSN